MKTNITKSIKNGEVKLYIEDNGYEEFETIGNLMDVLYEDEEYAIKNDKFEEFRNTKISLQLLDIDGQIVTGDVCLCVGWCGNRFVLTGNIQSVDGIKEDIK